MHKEEYKSKMVSLDDIVSMIKSNDKIVLAPGIIEPAEVIERLPGIADRVENVSLYACQSLQMYEIYKDPKYKKSFSVESPFHSPYLRAAQNKGRGICNAIPSHLRHYGVSLAKQKINMLIILVSPMDEHGYFTTGGGGTVYGVESRKADVVVAIVNETVPRTYGDTAIHISEVNYICENNRKRNFLPKIQSTEVEKKIGKYVADMIEDGSTIQLGIGGITNAAALELMDRKDLGVHTEMISDAFVDLFNAGVITGKEKTLFPGKMITCFSMGTEKVDEFINNNPGIFHFRASYANDPFTIAQNNKMISVNATLQVDLTGQCASEAIGTEVISGTGGQVETAIGAQMSEGGKSILTVRSTAMITKPGSKEKVMVSKIVPYLDRGSIVTLQRTDVEYIVSEYGVANLKGLSERERAKALIKIAHPKFRDELTEEARKYNIL